MFTFNCKDALSGNIYKGLLIDFRLEMEAQLPDYL